MTENRLQEIFIALFLMQAQCEDYLKRLIVALYADDSHALCELLQDPEVVDWSTRKTVCGRFIC